MSQPKKKINRKKRDKFLLEEYEKGKVLQIDNKVDNYEMFDGVMFKTFVYESNDVFTETFGKSRDGELDGY